MGSSKSSLLYLNVVREVAALCALLWLSSYLMRADLFFTNAVRNFFFAFFSNYRNGKNPVLQRPQLLPPPSFDGAFEGHRSFKKLFFPFVAYARVVTIKRFHHYFTTLPNWRRK